MGQLVPLKFTDSGDNAIIFFLAFLNYRLALKPVRNRYRDKSHFIHKTAANLGQNELITF